MERARTQHRLCGLLSGTLPLIPQQNVFLGLPLRLLAEEVVLLLRNGAGVLIDESSAYVEPNAEEREAFLATEARALDEQKAKAAEQQEAHRKRIEAAISEQGADAAALERRRARQAKKAAAGAAAEQPAPAPDSGADAAARAPYVHYTSGPSTGLPGYRPCTRRMAAEAPAPAGVNAYETLQEAAAAGVWNYPATLQERARCAVFEHLHSRGFYLSTGLRFGGEFVVYPGDPLRYHSHYTASVLCTPHEPLPAFQLIASGRLGTAVKKSHLLCQANTEILDDEEARERRLAGGDDAHNGQPASAWGNVECWSLAWAGFGT